MRISNKLVSYRILLVIFWQKLEDNIYRYVTGAPQLKRSQITADLFLGSQYSLIGLARLKALGITAIINMREHSVFTEAQYQGIRYLHLPTVDNSAPSMNDLIKGADFADDEIRLRKGKVYIHCRQGLGRGPTMTIAYLLRIGTTYEDAYELVRKVRTFIYPTVVQRARLKELETYYQQKRSEDFRNPASSPN